MVRARNVPEQTQLPSAFDAAIPPDPRFARDGNQRGFGFAHGLPPDLFSLPSLIALAQRRPANWEYAHWSRGPVAVGDRWEQGTQERDSLTETLAGIAHNNSFVMLRHVEQDAVFGPLIRAVLARLVELCGPALQDDVISGHCELIISSPRRITSYHIDADCNFLFQIAGAKQLRIYPTRDRAVVTDEDRERYHCGDYNGAHYRETLAPLATPYDLGPGLGLHIPSITPHSAQGGEEVSIGMSCAFDLHSMAREALICQFNRRLRRMGLRPVAPGLSPWRDALKLTMKQGLAALGRGYDKYSGAAAGEWRPAARLIPR